MVSLLHRTLNRITCLMGNAYRRYAVPTELRLFSQSSTSYELPQKDKETSFFLSAGKKDVSAE